MNKISIYSVPVIQNVLQWYVLHCISQVKDDEHFRLIALQFSWRGEKGKPMSSCFLGTSPEFEIAAYTVCFLSGKHGRNMDVQLGEYEVEISCIPLGRDCIGTAYIAAARMNQRINITVSLVCLQSVNVPYLALFTCDILSGYHDSVGDNFSF